jgi:hypothetical protein
MDHPLSTSNEGVLDKEIRTGPQSSRRSISVGFGTAAAGVFHKTDKRPSNFDQKARSDYSFKRSKNGPGCGAISLVRDRGLHCYAASPASCLSKSTAETTHTVLPGSGTRPTRGRRAGRAVRCLGDQSCMASTQAGLGRRSTLAARCRLGSTVATLAPRRTPYIWRFSMTRCT